MSYFTGKMYQIRALYTPGWIYGGYFYGRGRIERQWWF